MEMNENNRKDWDIQWRAYEICREDEVDSSEDDHLQTSGAEMDLRVSAMNKNSDIQRLRSLARPAIVRAEGSDEQVSLTVRMMGEPKSPFAVGDILRAGSSLVVRGGDLFLYVLEILPGKILVAAFSPFDFPASREELATGLDVEGLRVLSLWNVRWFLPGKLVRSWRVLHSAEELKTQVETLRNCLKSGGEIPDGLARNCGGEVASPFDPRWDYFRERGSFLGDLDSGLED